MSFNLVDGKITFITHKVEWRDQKRKFYSLEEANEFIARLTARQKEVEYTVIELEQPTVEQLEMVEGKLFNTYAEAKAFVETGVLPKTELQILQETVDLLVINSLGGA